MDRSLPTASAGFLKAEAGIFAPTLIEEVHLAVRERGPDQSGERIDDAAVLALPSGIFLVAAHDSRMNPSRPDVYHTLVSVRGRYQHSECVAPATCPSLQPVQE